MLPKYNKIEISYKELSEKTDKILEIVKEKTKTEKVLLFSSKQNFDALQKMLFEKKFCGIINIVPTNVNLMDLDDYLECNVLIASPYTLATGVTLLDFTTIVFDTEKLREDIFIQASRRSYRHEQKKDVSVYTFKKRP